MWTCKFFIFRFFYFFFFYFTFLSSFTPAPIAYGPLYSIFRCFVCWGEFVSCNHIVYIINSCRFFTHVPIKNIQNEWNTNGFWKMEINVTNVTVSQIHHAKEIHKLPFVSIFSSILSSTKIILLLMNQKKRSLLLWAHFVRDSRVVDLWL